MIGTASWSTGVMGEEQSGTQREKWLAWVPPPTQKIKRDPGKGCQERCWSRAPASTSPHGWVFMVPFAPGSTSYHKVTQSVAKFKGR